MPPQLISGTYQRYKTGTEKVLRWLYKNAQKCGYSIEVEQTDDEDEGGTQSHQKARRKGKRKSKSRKGKGSKAKGGGNAKSKTPCAAAAAPRLVSVNEYPALAEAIAAFDPRVHVPLWVTAMIEEVISGRKKAQRWFRLQLQADAGHKHFIGVLEDILEILKSIQGPSVKSATMDFGTSDPVDRITNIFNALEIETDTEHTMTEPKASTAREQKFKYSPNVVFEEDKSKEETLWLIYCFFEDFNIAREHLKDAWTAYKADRLDLTTVALSTNTAFELFKRAEEELLSDLRTTLSPDLMNKTKGYAEIQTLLFEATAKTRGVNTENRRLPGDPYNYNLWDIADWTCLPVYIILNKFLPVIQPESTPICKAGFFGTLNLTEDALYPDQKFTQDSIVLLEKLLPEFFFLRCLKDPDTKAGMKFPAEDELTTGILEMLRTKEIPTWLVLALQVQLDIHYMLLEDMKRPQSELLAAARKAVATVETYQDFSKDMHMSSLPKSHGDVTKFYLWEWNEWMILDILDRPRTDCYNDVNMPKEGEFVLLKAHPVLCGMMMFRLKLELQATGMAISGAWGAVCNVLHLYNACVAEKLLKIPWVDMEAIILANTAERVFVGDRPVKPQDYLKRFMLVIGYSATIFSANRRLSGLTPSKRGAREMLKKPIIAETYHKRFLRAYETRDPDSQRYGFALESIEKLLEESEIDLGETDHTSNDVGFPGGAFKTMLMEKRGEKALISKFAKSRKLTTIQLIKTLEASLINDAFAYNVDYFTLHMRCYQLLRNIKGEMDSVFTQHFGPHYVQKESQLPMLVGTIFKEVFDTSKTGEISFPVLAGVSRILTRLIQKEGDTEIEKVKNASRDFVGIEIDQNFHHPTLKVVELNDVVRKFNILPRNEKVALPNKQGLNHWHFSLRTISPRFDPPDLVWLINFHNGLVHCAVPSQGTHILSLKPTDQVDMVVFLLLDAFVTGISKRQFSHSPKFSPWMWSCDDSKLAKDVESKLTTLGVKKELCTVQVALENENRMSDKQWTAMQEDLIKGMVAKSGGSK